MSTDTGNFLLVGRDILRWRLLGAMVWEAGVLLAASFTWGAFFWPLRTSASTFSAASMLASIALVVLHTFALAVRFSIIALVEPPTRHRLPSTYPPLRAVAPVVDPPALLLIKLLARLHSLLGSARLATALAVVVPVCAASVSIAGFINGSGPSTGKNSTSMLDSCLAFLSLVKAPRDNFGDFL
jgi:hypothetical protein